MLHARRPARELARTRDGVHDRDEQARADEHKRPHDPVLSGHLQLKTLAAVSALAPVSVQARSVSAQALGSL